MYAPHGGAWHERYCKWTGIGLTHQQLNAGSRVKASPYAKKLAAEAGVSLEGIAGTGPEGRVVAEDVQKAIASGKVSQCIAQQGYGLLHGITMP